MKKNMRFIVLFYIGVAALVYALSLRVDQLESIEDVDYQNKTVVLKVR